MSGFCRWFHYGYCTKTELPCSSSPLSPPPPFPSFPPSLPSPPFSRPPQCATFNEHNAGGRRLFGRRFEPWCGQCGGGAPPASTHQDSSRRLKFLQQGALPFDRSWVCHKCVSVGTVILVYVIHYVRNVVWSHKTWVCHYHICQLHRVVDIFVVSLCPLEPTWL